jgi:Ribonuclease G/E
VGVIPSDETHAITIERHLRRTLAGRAADAVTVLVNPRIAAVLSGEDGERLADLQTAVGLTITLQPDASISMHDTKVIGANDEPTSKPAAKKATRGASARRRVSSRTAG